MSDSKKSTRVQFELPESSMNRLIKLKEKTEASSYAEVFKNAIRLYEDIISQFDMGNEFVIKEKSTGKEYIYRIF